VTALYTLDRDLPRGDVLDALAATPARLRALVESQSADALMRQPAGEWSAFQVCCHMRDAALVYSARFRWMTFDDDPVLPNYNEDNWVASSRDTPVDLPAILDQIAASRGDLIRVLSRLPDGAWTRTGRHEVIGRVELEPYVRHELAHEEAHLAQLQAALAASNS
jgi:hypothetical protein